MRASFGTGLSAMCGIGRVALLAVDDEVAVERAAPADLDLVADAVAARRLADDAGVQSLSPRAFSQSSTLMVPLIDGRLPRRR